MKLISQNVTTDRRKSHLSTSRGGAIDCSEDLKNSILGELDCAFGSKVAASMRDKVDVSKRSAEPLVLTILQRSVEGMITTSDQRSVLESLIWPFVARRSLRTREWFSNH